MTGGAVVLRTLADYQPFTLRAFCPTSGRSVPLDHEALARRFGWDMLLEDIRLWVRGAERDAGRRPGLTTEERQHLKALERENRDRPVNLSEHKARHVDPRRPPCSRGARCLAEGRDPKTEAVHWGSNSAAGRVCPRSRSSSASARDPVPAAE